MGRAYDQARRRRDRRQDAKENEELRHQVLDLKQAVLFLRAALDHVRERQRVGVSLEADLVHGG